MRIVWQETYYKVFGVFDNGQRVLLHDNSDRLTMAKAIECAYNGVQARAEDGSKLYSRVRIAPIEAQRAVTVDVDFMLRDPAFQQGFRTLAQALAPILVEALRSEPAGTGQARRPRRKTSLTDDEVLLNMFSGEDGAMMLRLWHGDLSDYTSGDNDEADDPGASRAS